MMEFFSMDDDEKREVINNALEAGPTIPFPNFSKLFKTWLVVLTSLSEEQRNAIFFSYINEIRKSPKKLIMYNLDGIFEIFLSLDESQKKILSNSIQKIIKNMEERSQKNLLLLIPQEAKIQLGI